MCTFLRLYQTVSRQSIFLNRLGFALILLALVLLSLGLLFICFSPILFSCVFLSHYVSSESLVGFLVVPLSQGVEPCTLVLPF